MNDGEFLSECPEWCVVDHESEQAFGVLPVHETLIGTLPSGTLVTRERCDGCDGVRVGHREPIALDDLEVLVELLHSIRRPVTS